MATATPLATTSATTPATPLAAAPVADSAPDLAPETEEAENKETTITTQELAQTEKQLNDEDEMTTASKKTTNV